MNGYFKLYRKIFTSDVWMAATAEQQIVMINLLGMACWIKTEVTLPYSAKVIDLKPGQFVTTYKEIENACNTGGIKRVTSKQLRTAIALLVKKEFISISNAGVNPIDGSLITIVKWASYQKNQPEGKEKGKEKGKENEARNAHGERLSENDASGEGKEKGKEKGKDTYLYKNRNKKVYKNNNAHTREQTQNQNQVNVESVESVENGNRDNIQQPECQNQAIKNTIGPADKVMRCMSYYQSAIHPFCSTVERDAVMQLAEEYDEYGFKLATDKAKENGVNHTRAWRYIAKILDTGGVRKFTNSARRKKNDVQASTEEALRILERGDLIDL